MSPTTAVGVAVIFSAPTTSAMRPRPAAMKSLVRGGRIVTCGATSGDAPSADLRRLFIRQLQVIGSTHCTFNEFANLLAVCGRGHLRPVFDSRYPLSDIHVALEHLESGQQFGKIGIAI